MFPTRIVLGILTAGVVSLIAADQPGNVDAWKKPVPEWTVDDAHQIMTDSPWVKTTTPSMEGSGSQGQRRGGGGNRGGRGGGINIGGIGIGLPGIGMGRPGGGYPGRYRAAEDIPAEAILVAIQEAIIRMTPTAAVVDERIPSRRPS